MLKELSSIQVEAIHRIYLANFENQKLSFYTNIDEPKEKSILWGMRDAGAASSGLPVITELLKGGINVDIIADGPARESVDKANLSLQKLELYSPRRDLFDLIGRNLKYKDLNLAVSGHAVKPDIEQALTYYSRLNYYTRGYSIPTVWYEDMPPFLAFYKRNLAKEGKLILPDYLFCFSESSANQNTDLIHDFEGKTVVVGNPAFDKFVGIDRVGTYKSARSKLGVEDDEIYITYMATKTRATMESFRDLVEGVKGLGMDRFRLSVRIHPQESKDAEIKKEYDAILAQVEEHGLDTTGYSTDDIGMASDLVVTDTSTAGFEAVLRDQLAMHILIPENMVLRDEWKDELPPDPSCVLDGTSPVVRTKDGMKDVLQQVLFDIRYQNELRVYRQVWIKTIGGATERFRDKLLELI